MSPEPAITGLRLALIALYLTVFWRTAFYTWRVTEKPAETRVRAWLWFRLGLVFLSGCVVFFYSPADILYAADWITAHHRLWMAVIGSFFNAIAAVCILTGLDVATGNKARAFPIYLAIIGVALLWATLQ